MDPTTFDHVEECSGTLETAAPKSLLATLEHIMGPIQNAGGGSILYDVADCQSIDAGAVLLFCYAFELSTEENRMMQIRGQGEPIQELSEHFTHYHRRKRGTRVRRGRKGLYPLRRIQDREEMLSELQEWAESVREGTEASHEQVALWQMQIAEVTTNAFQHGPVHKQTEAASSSIVAGKAAGRCVQLAALDFGSTIPRVIESVARQNNISKGDGALIAFACRKGVTSHSVRQNQGAGLYSLVQTVNESGGMLQILSRNGLAHFSRRKHFTRELTARPDGSPVLDGTLTIINLQI